jgi:hypothetical protein
MTRPNRGSSLQHFIDGHAPEAWPTLDDVRDATARSWCCPLHERVHQLLAVDVAALRTSSDAVDPTAVDGGRYRLPPWTMRDIDAAVAYLLARHGDGRVFTRRALRAAARAVGGRSVRVLRERLLARGVLVVVAARGRSACYRLDARPLRIARPRDRQ